MGLPSGTLWATMNVGAEKIEDIGNYYSWGETEVKWPYSLYNNAFYDELIPEDSYDALDHDAFYRAKSFKGVQGIVRDNYGHYFMNWFITDFAGSCPWEYEGKTYYFGSDGTFWTKGRRGA